MILRVCVSVVMMATALSVRSQVVPAATGETQNQDETPMRTPPPVSGEAYPTATGFEARSNYLRAGLTITPAYNDNVLPSAGSTAICDMTYSISPTLALDHVTPRLHQTLTYTPAITIYEHTSALNDLDQALSINYVYRMSQHSSVSMRDYFYKSSNVFNRPYSVTGTPIDGSPLATPQGIIAPWQNALGNTASGEVSYQYRKNRMLGAGGATTRMDYLDKAEAPDLGNSNSRSGSGFYNIRLSETKYAGVMYQYSMFQTSSAATQSSTQTHTVHFFFTFYPTHDLSLSLSGGPQRYLTAMPPFPDSGAWTPAVTASINWQANRVSLAASYSRIVTGGGGLTGSFLSNNANVSMHWQATRNWTIDPAANYGLQKNVNPALFSANTGGRTVSGSLSIGRAISEHIRADFAYQRLHQRYGSVSPAALPPDANRESISISYHLDRPLGR